MKEVSITLKEAKHLFDAMSGGTFSAEFRKDFVRKKISEIDQKIAKLETFKKTIIDM